VFEAVTKHIHALQAERKRVVVALWSDGSRERMAHVLADRHCFTQVVAGARPGEQLCDGLDSGHDPSSRVSTARVLARPSRSA